MTRTILNNEISYRSESRLMTAHFNDIRRYHPLEPEEERTLVARMLQGGREGAKARETLIHAHLRYAVALAKRYQRGWTQIEDLVAAAEEGLVNGIDHITQPIDCKVCSYVTPWMLCAVTDAVWEEMNTMHLPENALKVVREYEKLCCEYDDLEFSFEGLLDYVDEAHARERDLAQALQCSLTRSLDEPLPTEGEEQEAHTLVESLGNEASLADRHLEQTDYRRALLQWVRSVVDEHTTAILMDKYGFNGIDYTDAMLCEKYSLSICQLEYQVQKALNTLREYLPPTRL